MNGRKMVNFPSMAFRYSLGNIAVSLSSAYIFFSKNLLMCVKKFGSK